MGTGADDVSGTALLLRPWGARWKSCGRIQPLAFQFGSAVRATTISGELLIAQGDAHQGYCAARSYHPPHRHPASEQIWVALEGSGILLLDDERQEPITAGDVVRFADGDLHGFHNPGDVPFVYLSVTAPPVNFREAYSRAWTKTGPARMAMKNRP